MKTEFAGSLYKRVQGPVASDLAALEAIWGMCLRNNVTQPGAWKVALREKVPLFVLSVDRTLCTPRNEEV